MCSKMNLIPVLLLLLWYVVLVLGYAKTLKDLEEECSTLDPCIRKDPDVTELTYLKCVVKNRQALDVSENCRSTVFHSARSYFDDKSLQRTFKNACPDDLKTIDCSEQKFVFCIFEHREKFFDFYCQHIIEQLSILPSLNFALFTRFPELCGKEMNELCAFENKNNKSLISLDSNTLLDCLQKQIDKIGTTGCREEIFRISEFQGESIKLDRTLSKSCAIDKMKFCSDFANEDDERLYKCLQEFIHDLSTECHDELLKREKLVVKDPSISKGLVRSCKIFIQKHHCRKMLPNDKNIRLAQILLCLENAIHNGSEIARGCRDEIDRHRKLLMDDYRLSPEVMTTCVSDIERFCRGLAKNGKTIHCLLDHSRPRRRNQKIVSSGCQRSLETLLKVTDAGEDWRVDPVLRDACRDVVRNLCADYRGNDSKVMSCLMDNIESEYMEQPCEKALMEIQYFISRDFKLDPQLFAMCRDDAVKLCHAKSSWYDDPSSMDPDRGPLVLSCLYRYAYIYNSDHPESNIKLKPSCEEHVKRVMRQRAIRVALIPEIEQSCLDDLASYCRDATKPGEEMLCLQDKYSSLNPKCRVAVGNFTEAEASDINLNPIIKQHCRVVIDTHCKEELRGVKGEKGAVNDVMSCLIKHKNDADVKIHYKCRAAVDHFQLISLNDYHFTVAFKDACRSYVIHYCPKAHTKAQVVECLSEVTQNDTLKDERYKLSKECRYQLRSQLLQQREFIDLDPKLKSACEKDIKTFCKKIDRKSDTPVLECLEEHLSSLSSQCHKMVFRIEQQDFKDSSSDYTLLTTCKLMIKVYCKSLDVSQALTCLKKLKDEPLFDNNCKSLVLKRMVEQSADYRLNPALQRGCSQDIGKFCFALMKNHVPDVEFEGKILNCLKIKFRERKLRKDCEKQLSVVLKEAALNYKLNPLLRSLCTQEIQMLCKADVEAEEHDGSGRVEECLKVAFLDGRINGRACRIEVAGLIEEAKADIHVDPILHNACIPDINKFCIDVPRGAGRILQCLQALLSSSKQHLQPDCRDKLTQRLEMFRNAEPLLSEPQSFENLLDHVNRSPLKLIFFSGLIALTGFIFLAGLVFGRLTRRSTMSKNK